MASAVLHIKDSYYFEAPKFLLRSHRNSREDFPDYWVKLDPDYQLWEAGRQHTALEKIVPETPEWAELKEQYLHSRDHIHRNMGKPFDRFLEEAPANQAWFQEKLTDADVAAEWQAAKHEAEDLQAYSETEEWSAGKIAQYNHQLDGKVLIPQPFATLRNNYEVEAGFGISKFMIIELVVAAIIAFVFIRLAGRMRKEGRPRGKLWNMFEAVLLFLRDEVARPAIGKHEADRFVPLLWTIFLFVLGMNLFGMLPWAGAPTGAFGVTFGLACVTFATVVVSGVIKFGPLGFLKNQVPSMGLPLILAIPIVPMIFAIEVLGLFIKHTVLSVRLLANMVAGHLVLLGIMGLAFSLEGAMSSSWPLTAVIAVVGSTLFSCLELFVAFLQAYIFTFLSALFIGAAVHHH